MKAAQRAIIIKDIQEVLNSRQMIVPMVMVPLVLTLLLPIVLFITAQYGASGINGLDLLMERFHFTVPYGANAQKIIYMGVHYIFPIFFIFIPIMASSIIGASSFVGEKEHKTLETLLYSPINIQQFFIAKVVGTFIPAYLVTLASFVLFGIVVNIGGWFYFRQMIFPTGKWLLLIFWLAPALALLGLTFIVFISAKASTFQEAQQMSGFIVLPVVLLFIGQIAGVVLLDSPLIFILGLLVFVLDYILLQKAARKFTPEQLI